MGPSLLLLLVVGDILGTGIYALTGQVARQVGGVVWLPFLAARRFVATRSDDFIVEGPNGIITAEEYIVAMTADAARARLE